MLETTAWTPTWRHKDCRSLIRIVSIIPNALQNLHLLAAAFNGLPYRAGAQRIECYWHDACVVKALFDAANARFRLSQEMAMHIIPRALGNPAAYGPANESTESRFDVLANAFGPGPGCTSSWASGCSRHHYHSWNDPTLQKHVFSSIEEGRLVVRETLARGARSPLRLARALVARLLKRPRAE